MKSVRLDARTEARLREAARLAGVPESRLIRDAIAERSDAILSNRLYYQMADLIGGVTGGAPPTARSHASFEELLDEEHRRQVRSFKRTRGVKSRSS